jgi:hypothetical protein
MENIGMKEYRKRIRLSEDLILSVIRSSYSYGGTDGLYEVALLSEEGDFMTHVFFPELGDDVIGWLELSDVKDIVEEITKQIS